MASTSKAVGPEGASAGRDEPADTLALISSRFARVRPLCPTLTTELLVGEQDDGASYVIKQIAAGSDAGAQRVRLAAESEALRATAATRVVPFDDVSVDGRRLYLVRRFVEGEALDVWLTRTRPAIREVLELARNVLVALSDLHARGVIHRNLKPSNVVIDRASQQVRLVDVGLAHDLLDERATLAELARYVAPEQAGLLHHGLEEATDLYLFGLLLFEALAGRPPFGGETVGDILRQHLTAPTPSLRTLGLAVPRAVDDVIERLLRKDPRDRYRTAAGALGDLTEIVERLDRGDADPDIVIGAYDRRNRLTEPGFIGRAGELAAFAATFEQTCHGAGTTVCIEAESGGGKSRLLDEVARRSEQRGLWVLRGSGEANVATRPFQLLGGLVEQLADHAARRPEAAAALRARLGAHAEDVAQVLPVLADALLETTPAGAGPEAFGEIRTLQAVAHLFDALGAPDRPALIVLDDCQWTDELTIKLLARWASEEPEKPTRYVSILVAYRSEEVPADHSIRSLPAQRVVLEPFDRDEVRGIVESMAGQVPDEACELVIRLAEGNPFMACAVLRGLVEAGALTPDGDGWRIEAPAIADVRSSGHAVGMLHRRLELLPQSAQSLLTAAAVLGKEFELATAQQLADQPSAQSLEAVAEARARHIVWPAARPGRYVFTHDKLRETLLGRLDAPQRRALHREAAARLESAGGDVQSYDLAYHFDAAGESQRAFPYALAAADEARSRFALEIAERYYRIADRGAVGSDARTRYHVSVGLGEVLMLRGSYDAAGRAFERARHWAQGAVARAELEGNVGELAFKRGDPRQAYVAISRGLRLLDRTVPRTRSGFFVQALREIVVQAAHTLLPGLLVARLPEATEAELVAVRLYSRLAYAFWFTRGAVPTLWAHLRGMNLAEAHPPTPELAQAYSEHAPVATMIPWFERGRRYAIRSLELRKDNADRWGQGQSMHFLGIIEYGSGRYRETIEACREAARILRRTGDRWEALTASWHTAIAMYRLGDLTDAVTAIRRVYEEAAEIGDRQVRGIALGIWAKASEGRVPEELVRRELADESDDVHATAELLMAEGLRLLRAGKADEAVAALREARDRVRERRLRQEYVAPVLPWLATAHRVQAEGVPPWAERDRRVVRRGMRRAVRGALAIARSYRNNLPHALREAGYLAAMDGRSRRARSFFDESLETARAQKARYEEALTLEAIGRVGRALGWAGAVADGERAERMLATLREGLDSVSLTDADIGRVTLSLVDRFASIVDSGRKIASALSADAVYAATCEAFSALLRCEEAAVLVVTEDDSKSVPPRVVAGEVRAGFSARLIESAVELGYPISYSADAPIEAATDSELANVASALCAPIFARGRAVACVYVIHRYVADLFDEDDDRLAAFITTIAGAALENAEGFLELQQVNALLDARSKELERSNTELTQFAYVASHDLQEPLRNVASYVQLLDSRYRGRLDEKADRYIQGAVEGVGRMRTLILDLLAYSRVTTRLKPMATTDLAAVFDEVVSSFAPAIAETGARITRDELPTALADRTQIAQLFQNLISNALKFVGDDPPTVHASAERTGGEWTVSVRDNGIGVDPKYGEQIFIIFKRLHTRSEYPGTGIGLAICAKIVERHGGRIWVESTPGAGATFRFTIPTLRAGSER